MNRDDILFISSGALTNEGHFENVGDTARDGLELTASGTPAPYLRWDASYTFLRARFAKLRRSSLSSPNHPDEVDGEILYWLAARCRARHATRFAPASRSRKGRATVGGDLAYSSSSYLRGDEANLLPLFEGRTVVDLNGSYLIGKRIRLAARVTNLFGADYSTFGLLGEADDVLGAEDHDLRFLSPGAPRAAWVGIEFVFCNNSSP